MAKEQRGADTAGPAQLLAVSQILLDGININ